MKLVIFGLSISSSWGTSMPRSGEGSVARWRVQRTARCASNATCPTADEAQLIQQLSSLPARGAARATWSRTPALALSSFEEV
jgi:hypothetical protein